VEFIILIGLLILVPLWAEKGHGIGSLEWGMAIYSKMMKIKN